MGLGDDFKKIEELAEQQKRQMHAAMQALANRAAAQKDAKTAIYTAEGKLMIREARSTIREIVEKYRTDRPADLAQKGTPEYEGSFAEKLDAALDKLEQADKQLEKYVTEKTPSAQEAFAWYREESDSYLESMKTLNAALDDLNEGLAFKESDKNDAFLRLYAQTASLHSLMNSIEKGNLNVPAPETRTEGGKKIHFVDTTKHEHQPLAKTYDPNTKGYIVTNDYAASDAGYVKRYGDPLFAHDPCPEDVCQGGLGNCYMLSMLSSIAAQDPQLIKDAMVDNGKTVTVRFYNESHEPVYVTVDKSVPGKMDDKSYAQIYSRGPLWVQMMEKAFAASGLMNGRLKDAERGTYMGNHADIDKGYAMDFLTLFLGKTYVPNGHIGGGDIAIPSPNTQSGMTMEEYDFIQKVMAAQENGAILYAGTRFKKNTPAIQKEKQPNRDDFTGIYSDHAHSLHGVVHENGKWYVRVRNPHGHMGRVYDANGNATIENDANGYNLVDIKMFGHYFDMVQYADVPMDAGYRARAQEVADMKAMYGDAVMAIEKTLRQSDAFYLKKKNSQHFKDMRAASAHLKELFSPKHYPSPNMIKREFNKLFKAANAYLDYRDSQVRDYDHELSNRATNRYQMAEAVTVLETLYKDNPTMRKADPAKIEEKLKTLGANPSAAKRASVQVFMNRHAAGAAIPTAGKQNDAPVKDNGNALNPHM